MNNIKKWAKIYQLATVAHMDCGGCETDIEQRVTETAILDARKKLKRMGIDYQDVTTLNDCIIKNSFSAK